jgi:hypothetical protein
MPRRAAKPSRHPPGDPLRALLARAQDAASNAHAKLARKRKAADELQRIVWGDPAKVEAAEKAIEKAGAALATAIGDAAAEGKEAPNGAGVRKARQALVEVQDQAAANKVAHTAMRADIKEIETEVRDSDVAVEAAISAIIAPLASEAIERTAKLVEMVRPHCEALAALWAEVDRPSAFDAQMDFNTARAPLDALRKRAAEVLQSAKSIYRASPDPWIEARKMLRADPHAKLDQLSMLLGGKPPSTK